MKLALKNQIVVCLSNLVSLHFFRMLSPGLFKCFCQYNEPINKAPPLKFNSIGRLVILLYNILRNVLFALKGIETQAETSIASQHD